MNTPPPPPAIPVGPPPPFATRVKLKLRRICRELGSSRQDREWTDARPLVNSVEGWMLPEQERWLFDAAYSLPNAANIVEIGSFKGRSTCALAFGCKGTGKRVFAIDTFNGNGWDLNERDFFGKFSENVKRCGLSKYVEPIVGLSVEVGQTWSKPIHLLFIDGSHEYEAVKTDFETFVPHVVPGGIIAFHDVIEDWPGPLRFWQETAKAQLSDVGYCESLAHGRKPIPAGLPATSGGRRTLHQP